MSIEKANVFCNVRAEVTDLSDVRVENRVFHWIVETP